LCRRSVSAWTRERALPATTHKCLDKKSSAQRDAHSASTALPASDWLCATCSPHRLCHRATSAAMMPARTRPGLVTRCWALRASPVSSCMMYHWALAVQPCASPSSSFGSFASSHQARENEPGDGSARTCHACSSSTTVPELPFNHLLCAARLEIRLAPGSDSCDAAVCSPVHWFAATRPALSGNGTRT
jgi:hypothetical protein